MDWTSVHSGATAKPWEEKQWPAETGIGHCLNESERVRGISSASRQIELQWKSEAA